MNNVQPVSNKKKKSNAEYLKKNRPRTKIYQLLLTLMNYQQTLIRLRLLIFL